jgi:hypothetical protein
LNCWAIWGPHFVLTIRKPDRYAYFYSNEPGILKPNHLKTGHIVLTRVTTLVPDIEWLVIKWSSSYRNLVWDKMDHLTIGIIRISDVLCICTVPFTSLFPSISTCQTK